MSFFFVQIIDNARPDYTGGCFPFALSTGKRANLPFFATATLRKVGNWEIIGRLQ